MVKQGGRLRTEPFWGGKDPAPLGETCIPFSNGRTSSSSLEFRVRRMAGEQRHLVSTKRVPTGLSGRHPRSAKLSQHFQRIAVGHGSRVSGQEYRS